MSLHHNISPLRGYDILIIKFRYHMRIARLYQDIGIFSDAMNEKHPVIYSIADKRWRYHAHECLEVLHRQDEIIKTIKGPEYVPSDMDTIEEAVMNACVDEERLRNAPKERIAQIMANKIIKMFFGDPKTADINIWNDVLDACRREVGAFTAQ